MTAEGTAQWFAAWWPLWSPFALLLLGGASAGIWAIITRRGGEKAARKNPLPPTWPEMWARIDAQDKRIDAQDEEIAGLKEAVKEKDAHLTSAIAHIDRLEPLVPNPPGPPARPAWMRQAAA